MVQQLQICIFNAILKDILYVALPMEPSLSWRIPFPSPLKKRLNTIRSK